MNMTLTQDITGSSVRAGDIELPLGRVDIKGRIDGTGVVWTVTQEFVNSLEEAMEAVYTFPLPVGGAVNRVVMHIGDRVIVAEMKERGQARVEYEEALAKGQTAMLMEQDAAEIFQTTVGNIHPGETITIETVVHDTVKRDGTEAQVRFPTLIRPRYIPDGTPNADALNPPRHAGDVHVGSLVEITFAGPVAELVCDTIEEAELSPVSARITDFSLDRDIILRWEVDEESMDAKWTPDDDNPNTGTVEVVIRTNSRPTTGMRKRRALSILLDRSGSMGDSDMKSGIRVAVDAIDALDKDDLVHVLTFDSVVEALDACGHGFVNATGRTKAALKRELNRIESRGGTQLDRAITASGAALGLLDDTEGSDGIERVVLLITDGAYGDEATAARQREIELRGARVIVVGIGQTMNGYLETLAANGWFANVSSAHRVGEVAKQVCERINTPAHRNASLAMDGLSDQAPHLTPDIYPGAVVTLWGRAPKPAPGTHITVNTDSGPIASIPVRVCDDASATSRWAKARINAVDYDVMTGRIAEAEGRDTIIALSVTRRVLSKYTAWIAVDTSRTTDSIIPKRVVQPSYDDYALEPRMLRSAAYSPSRVSASYSMVVDELFSAPSISYDSWTPDVVSQLRDVVTDLQSVLSGGKGHLDWQSVSTVLQDLRDWLDDNDETVIGRRAHGKIARRVAKLGTVDIPPQNLQWKILNEILRICQELVAQSDSLLAKLRNMFP
ncbi:MAG: hypothetical protein RLZZ526_1952 [Actinomycetota bacterium]